MGICGCCLDITIHPEANWKWLNIPFCIRSCWESCWYIIWSHGEYSLPMPVWRKYHLCIYGREEFLGGNYEIYFTPEHPYFCRAGRHFYPHQCVSDLKKMVDIELKAVMDKSALYDIADVLYAIFLKTISIKKILGNLYSFLIWDVGE